MDIQTPYIQIAPEQQNAPSTWVDGTGRLYHLYEFEGLRLVVPLHQGTQELGLGVGPQRPPEVIPDDSSPRGPQGPQHDQEGFTPRLGDAFDEHPSEDTEEP